MKTFAWLSGVRWAIEQCFEEAKSDLGMDHYEVRKFPGWRHHMLTCIVVGVMQGKSHEGVIEFVSTRYLADK
ncbi:MAG: hypothetical protein JRD69_03930 [Deltaproteobacteria bacterium]|nr:hypothetical protein [Deltaproteobacteria bacterium]